MVIDMSQDLPVSWVTRLKVLMTCRQRRNMLFQALCKPRIVSLQRVGAEAQFCQHTSFRYFQKDVFAAFAHVSHEGSGWRCF